MALAAGPAGAQGHFIPLVDVTDVQAGFLHSCGVATGRGTLCWGYNHHGQLGQPGELDTADARPVQALPGIAKSLAPGKFHTCAVINGGAWCWGLNQFGQLGNGSFVNSRVPVPVTGLSSGVSAIVTGDYHSCAIIRGGVKCWGSNFFGSLGNASTDDSSVPVSVRDLSQDVDRISAGELHTCALVLGAVKCWGNNYSGQLGLGYEGGYATTPRLVNALAPGVRAIGLGSIHSCAVRADGTAACWGYNARGQLGDGTTDQRTEPVTVAGLSGADHIVGGQDHSCALADGNVHCWGDNRYYQLGLDDEDDSLVPSPVAGLSGVGGLSGRGYHNCVLMPDRTSRCWGLNAYGELGDGSAQYQTEPVVVEGLPAPLGAVAGGIVHTCAAVPSGVHCWGSNGKGQMGLGEPSLYSTVPLPVVEITQMAVSVGAGYQHTCAAVNGAALCWGDNSHGQLGDGTDDLRPAPQVVSGLSSQVSQVAAGGRQSCAIRNGSALCWGMNTSGELGNGLSVNSALPVQVKGLTSGVTAVSMGANHACAIHNGAAKCWGVALDGQIGNGTNGMPYGTPTPVTGLSSGVTAISAGATHTCAIHNGAARCWGYDGYGQLGNGVLNDAQLTPAAVVGLESGVTAIAAGEDISCAIANGSVYCWGANYFGDLGAGLAPRTMRLLPTLVIGMSGIAGTQLNIGGNHVCASVIDGSLRCWGDNYFGQLGARRRLLSATPVTVVVNDLLWRNSFE
ncbi:hypothetical protein [Tahibacter amnicola]|uniref:RCC1-like domain-containing protein n=1 Tax=Tahibacter amnicola TaxID=2976241 RepID=A0ABY6BG13_9GAMM|nr:hypothetical protein [Tahibacter amnicola]UXI68015.1 hypothetical protein N4264_25360 [Tahibacter amnicola]